MLKPRPKTLKPEPQTNVQVGTAVVAMADGTITEIRDGETASGLGCSPWFSQKRFLLGCWTAHKRIKLN